jgi:hypothetical protein
MLCLLQTSADSPLALDAGLAPLLSALYPMILLVALSALLFGLFQFLSGHRESSVAMIVTALMMIGMIKFFPIVVPAVGDPAVPADSSLDGLGRSWPILWRSTVTVVGAIAAGYALLHLRQKRIQRQKTAVEAALAAEQQLAFLNWLDNESLKLQIDTLPGMTEQQRFLLERMAWAAQQTFDPEQLGEVWKELRCALGDGGDGTTATMGSPL